MSVCVCFLFVHCFAPRARRAISATARQIGIRCLGKTTHSPSVGRLHNCMNKNPPYSFACGCCAGQWFEYVRFIALRARILFDSTLNMPSAHTQCKSECLFKYVLITVITKWKKRRKKQIQSEWNEREKKRVLPCISLMVLAGRRFRSKHIRTVSFLYLFAAFFGCFAARQSDCTACDCSAISVFRCLSLACGRSWCKCKRLAFRESE